MVAAESLRSYDPTPLPVAFSAASSSPLYFGESMMDALSVNVDMASILGAGGLCGVNGETIDAEWPLSESEFIVASVMAASM